jgi:hypothetical protein
MLQHVVFTGIHVERIWQLGMANMVREAVGQHSRALREVIEHQGGPQRDIPWPPEHPLAFPVGDALGHAAAQYLYVAGLPAVEGPGPTPDRRRDAPFVKTPDYVVWRLPRDGDFAIVIEFDAPGLLR